MFTGIIEELGIVDRLNFLKDLSQLTIQASKVLENTKIGDSIAVNGICLTVIAITAKTFTVDVMRETLEKTNLRQLNKKSCVNLELALQLQTRLGGHLVSGHVDGTGQILSIKEDGIAKVYKIGANTSITDVIIPKGSIAVDGISLTVIETTNDYFTVSIIPHTAQKTTLDLKGPGDIVNLETDLIGKYVARLLKHDNGERKSISLGFLSECGFL